MGTRAIQWGYCIIGIAWHRPPNPVRVLPSVARTRNEISCLCLDWTLNTSVDLRLHINFWGFDRIIKKKNRERFSSLLVCMGKESIDFCVDAYLTPTRSLHKQQQENRQSIAQPQPQSRESFPTRLHWQCKHRYLSPLVHQWALSSCLCPWDQPSPRALSMRTKK